MELLAWMESWGLSLWVRESDYGYYLMLNAHAIGMAVVVGVVLMLDLRVLGYAHRLPLGVFDRLLTIGWVGFGVNAASGFILFAAQGQRYLQNWPFIVKMVLILLGGLLMWLLGRMMRNSDEHLGIGIGRAGRLATFSFACWIGAIVAGRVIAYTLAPPPPPAFL